MREMTIREAIELLNDPVIPLTDEAAQLRSVLARAEKVLTDLEAERDDLRKRVGELEAKLVAVHNELLKLDPHIRYGPIHIQNSVGPTP